MSARTTSHPDHVETVDLRGARGRAVDPDRTEPAAERAAGLDPAAVAIGRYQLLAVVGAGGTGLVGAWDPELERRVALKLVRWTASGARDRIQREGQVLARLSHPNVVPIYDVGVLGESIYLVMEWVRGETLRAFAARGSGVAAVVDAYRQAGEGLAAAHRAGVVHRDFKPDNAIRGDDGRVRVLDFGLALAGDAVTAAGDQFAFGASLREALGDGAPAWLAAIVARATADDPARRFASMAALLAALARDPARRRRRVVLGAVATLVAAGGAAGAFALGGARAEAPAIEPCSGGAAQLATAWSPTRRAELAAHLAAIGAAPADVARVTGQLDRGAADWLATYRGACVAHQRRALADDRYEVRLACLAQSRAALDSTAGLLAGVDGAALEAARATAASLPDPDACARDDARVVAPPAAAAAAIAAAVPQIERALVYAKAERTDARALARAATAAARATHYGPVIARALLVEGRAAAISMHESRPQLEEAMAVGLASFEDAIAVEAYARLVEVRANVGVSDTDGWPVMVAVAERLGERGRRERTLLYRAGALAHRVGGDIDGARALLHRAVDARGSGPVANPELLLVDSDLAVVEPDRADAARAARRGLDALVPLVGAEHTQALHLRLALAYVTTDRAQARTLTEGVCHVLQDGHHEMAACDCAILAAWLADEDGDEAAALAWFRQVVDSSNLITDAIADATVATMTGAPDGPARIAALDRAARAYRGGSEWTRWVNGESFIAVARAADRRGDLAASTDAWARGLALLDELHVAYALRMRARAAAVLAERWAATRPDDARRLATAALAWYRGVPGDEARVARLAAIAR